MAVAPVIIMPFAIFGGFLSNADNYMDWIGWLQYVSPIRYGFEFLVRNEFEDFETPENQPDTIDILGLNVGKWYSAMILILMGIFIRLLAFYCLNKRIRKF